MDEKEQGRMLLTCVYQNPGTYVGVSIILTPLFQGGAEEFVFLLSSIFLIDTNAVRSGLTGPESPWERIRRGLREKGGQRMFSHISLWRHPCVASGNRWKKCLLDTSRPRRACFLESLVPWTSASFCLLPDSYHTRMRWREVDGRKWWIHFCFKISWQTSPTVCVRMDHHELATTNPPFFNLTPQTCFLNTVFPLMSS